MWNKKNGGTAPASLNDVNVAALKLQTDELEWAHIFHDTIKDRDWLRKLSISPGRWAGNYSFFYILVRILTDYKPQRILEFGLGESSKVISAFLEHSLPESKLLSVEQDDEWAKAFKQRVKLNANFDIIHLPLQKESVKGFEVNAYSDFSTRVKGKFDLYVIDGPLGSPRFSRHQVCLMAEMMEEGDEFIFIIDDYNRPGEQDTAAELMEILKRKNIPIFSGIYAGNKSQIVITSEKYRFATSL